MSNYSKLEFECPVCGQKLKAKAGRFECNHKGTTHQKGMLSDADKFELDEVHTRIIYYLEGKK